MRFGYGPPIPVLPTPLGRSGARIGGGGSVRLFLADGIANGLIVAHVGNWTGKVLAAPRARLSELLKRGEAFPDRHLHLDRP